MNGMKVASRYAQALIELAEELKVVDKVLDDMKLLLTASNQNKDFYLFLNSPLIKADKKNNIFDKLFGDFQEVTIKFIHLLTKNRREILFPLIAEEYIAKLNTIRKIVPLTLTSAVELDSKIKDEILNKLKRQIDGDIELTEEIDASLIGGFVVRMGDTRIDASVAHQLNKMKNRLMS